jgi:F-type H+-transporting ATPase subunit delta
MADTAQDSTMIRAIDRIYARALLELAEENGSLEEVADQMADIATLISENPRFGQVLRSPSVDDAGKQEMLDHAFRGQVNELIYRFILVLRRKNRLPSFAGIVLAFRQLYNEKHGVMEVTAEVAQPLNEASRTAVEQWVAGLVNRIVAVKETVNEDLLGGFKLRAGDHQYDASVATQLRQLRRQLTTAGETTARGLVNQIVTE